MWAIDVTYRETLNPTFERLFDKLKSLNAARPLPNIALEKIKELK